LDWQAHDRRPSDWCIKALRSLWKLA